MTAEVALATALFLILIVIRAGASADVKLPKLERAWFHLSITWPVAVKAALGSFIFSQAADEGANYAIVTYGPAAVVAVVLFLRRLRGDAKVFAPGLILFTMVMFSVPYLVFGDAGVAAFLPLLMSLPVVLRRWDAVPVSAWFGQARVSVLVLAGALLMTALTARTNVIGMCRMDKCSAFGEVLTSPITNNGNFAGVAVAILLPWALLGLPRFPMLLMSGASLLLIELSGSRSAAVAAWAVVAVVILASGNWAKRAWLAWGAFYGALLATIVTAVGDFPASFATWRGSLWARARELFAEAPFVGAGPNRWVQQPPENNFIANYSPHNFWLEIAVAGGVLALVATVVAAVLLLRKVEAGERYVFVLAGIALLALGILESPVQLGRSGLAPFSHLLPLMVAASSAVASRTVKRSVTSPHALRLGAHALR